ncbi:MAG: signal peptidase I [Clostridiales bacterium]|nr:signal peptidase I [Clostridiales bacterium]
MLKIYSNANALDMSRVERNQDLYKEAEADSVRRGSKVAGHILSTLGAFIMLLVIAACLIVVVPGFAGYRSYVVASGSMEPLFPVGTIVYVEETEPLLLRTGEIIVFRDPSRGTTPITHRVVANNTDKQLIRTKGDANEGEDINPVTYENVIGTVEYYLPYAGYATFLFANTFGKIVACLILVEAWLLMELGRRMKMRAERSNQ